MSDFDTKNSEEQLDIPEDTATYLNMIPIPTIIYDSSFNKVFSNNAGGVVPPNFDIRPYLPDPKDSSVQTRPLIISLEDSDGNSHQFQYSLDPIPGKEQYMLTLSDITEQSVQKRVLETVIQQSNDNFVVIAPFGDWPILYSSNQDYMDGEYPKNNTAMSKIHDMIAKIPPIPENLQMIADLQNIDLDLVVKTLKEKGVLNYQLPQQVDGKLTWINIRMVPIMSEYYPEDVDYVGFMINDITSFKKHDETGEFNAVLGNEFSRDELIETVSYAYTRLRSLFEMLSHDIKTPLTLAQHAAQRARKPDVVYDSLTDRSLNSISYHISMMTTMLANVDLLISKGEYVASPLERSVAKLGDQIRGTFANQKEVQVRVLELDSDPNAIFDQNIMKHIAMNLVSNAVKYNRNNGPIHVNIWKGEKESDDELIMEVTDQGIGIPEEDLASIFEFKKRASNSGNIKGTGIGLSVVKRLVEAHGGTIEVESEVNKGTRFTVRILKSHY